MAEKRKKPEQVVVPETEKAILAEKKAVAEEPEKATTAEEKKTVEDNKATMKALENFLPVVLPNPLIRENRSGGNISGDGGGRSRYTYLPNPGNQQGGIDEISLPPSHVDKHCLRFLDIFPSEYEIDRDTLIQLFLATGLHAEESTTAACVDTIEHAQYLSRLRQKEERTGKLWYKVTGGGHYPYEFNVSCGYEHVTVQQLPANNIEDLLDFRQLKTLWFLNNHKSQINSIPYKFFTCLNLLRVLNLSGTKISELPNSIRHIRGLVYLDMSDTFLKNLPESIGHLQDLQTLKLQNCRYLVTLPKNTTRLIKLQHLDLGEVCCLHSMPPGIGDLTYLRTLSAFLVANQPRCGIAELGNLHSLQGELILSRLENVASPVEATAAKLQDKSLLRSLVLQWSPKHGNSRVEDDAIIIDHLRPNTNLKYLQLDFYKGSQFPSWIDDPCFTNLVSISLINADNCHRLPSLGRLPSLEFLTLKGLSGIRFIDHHFCGGVDDENNAAFPNLKNLALISFLSLEEWKDMHKSNFPSLIHLEMENCPKLVTICSLSNMLSLQHLEISNCPLLPSLSEGSLPASVKELVIEDCPLLTSSCSKYVGGDWHKIRHVSSIWIDYEDVSNL